MDLVRKMAASAIGPTSEACLESEPTHEIAPKPKPSSIDDLLTEAAEIGLDGPKRREVLETPRGSYLAACYESWKIHRSFNHVSMILLGLSGAGKSTTVNHLLGIEIAKTSHQESETRATTEFIVSDEAPSLGVSNLSLGIINTPGFNDISGLEEDARNLASIDAFCKNSPNLKDSLPNIIMIVFDATDKRFSGPHSPFKKSLMAFSELKLVNVLNPNIVVVITHACSVPIKRWKSVLDEKSAEIRRLVQETLKVDPPVVVLENDIDRHDLELSEDKQQSKLPDGQFQPNNLFFTLADLLIDSKDCLGLKTIKHFFGTSLGPKKKVKVGHSEKAKDGPRTQELNKNLEDNNYQQPEIVRVANDYVSNNGAAISESDRNAIKHIGNEIVQKIGITKLEDLRTYNIETILGLLTIEPSDSIVYLLKEAYHLKPVSEALKKFLSVGRGYNILFDEIKPAAVIKTDDTNCRKSHYGILLPNGIEMSQVNESETFMQHFRNEKDYIRHRLGQLSLGTDFDVAIFQMKSRGGFSYSKSKESKSSFFDHSFMYEQRIFRVDLTDLTAVQVSDQFQSDVRSTRLPETYDKSDPKNREAFKDFFDRWGHFVVSSAFGGGSAEVKLKNNSSDNRTSKLLKASHDFEISLKEFFSDFNSGSQRVKTSGDGAYSKLLNSSMKWIGGEVQCHVSILSELTLDKWTQWKTSLVSDPAILTTEMSLIPIWDIVYLVDPNKMEGCRDALKDLLGGKFIVYRKRESKAEEMNNRGSITDRKEAANSVGDGTTCFPGLSKVTVKNSSKHKLMQDLEIGDEVLCYNQANGELFHSPVFMFGHRNPEQASSYLEVKTAAGAIFISDKHLIFRQDQSGGHKAVFAEDIKPGDKIYQVETSGEGIYQVDAAKDRVKDLAPNEVVSVRKTTCKGVYAPFTLAGTIVVDGTLASCYAHIAKPSLFGMVDLCPHSLAHKALAPLRGLHGDGLSSRLVIKDGQDQPEIIKSMTEQFRGFLAF